MIIIYVYYVFYIYNVHIIIFLNLSSSLFNATFVSRKIALGCREASPQRSPLLLFPAGLDSSFF